jgi:Family of unknown function (DUF5719)
MKIQSFLKSSRNLLDERIFGIAVILTMAFAISYAAPVAQEGQRAQSDYPATVCPAKLGDGTTTAFLPKYNSLVRHVTQKSISFYKSKTASENISQSALLVDSNPATTFVLNNSGNGIGMAICESGNADQWFVGGSGGVTSKGQLDIVNSGLSSALVDITPYTSKQVLPVVSVSIPANSDRSVLVDALVPGDETVALHVVTRNGRVTSFLFDRRKKGLKALGSDYVNSQATPSQHLVIPAILQSSSGKVASTLRILVPGNLDANVKLTLNSGDGAFTPVGFDGRVVPHGKVFDIPLASLTSSTPMSVVLDSDQPVVASVLTQFGSSDFAWATPVLKFTNVSFNFTGLSPKFVFTGSAINIGVSWKSASGKSLRAKIKGSDIAFWSPSKSGLKTVTFTNLSKKPAFGGVILRNSTGAQIAYLPLTAGATLEKSSLPVVDVRSLSR